MTSDKNAIPMSRIERWELPAYERRGCVAQEVPGKEILVITLHQTRVDLETSGGVAAQVPSKLRSVHPGVSDTVLLGSLYDSGHVALLDVLMVNQKSYRGKSWKDRLDALVSLCASLPRAFNDEFWIAGTYTYGLMRVFDRVVEKEGLGLLLRIEGKPQAILCRLYGEGRC
jgi:hypothetical protein